MLDFSSLVERCFGYHQGMDHNACLLDDDDDDDDDDNNDDL